MTRGAFIWHLLSAANLGFPFLIRSYLFRTKSLLLASVGHTALPERILSTRNVVEMPSALAEFVVPATTQGWVATPGSVATELIRLHGMLPGHVGR